jgi:hypothetical protein
MTLAKQFPKGTPCSTAAQQSQFKSSEGLAPEHPAAQFLQLIGKDPGQTWFRTIRPGKGANSSRGGKDLHGLDLDALTRDNQAGESIYFVSGNSSGPSRLGVAAKDVTSCPALFAEWDDKPMEWQLQAWQELGLPEPTIQLLTGGKSVHCYWLLDKPMDPTQWRPLQAQLIDHCGSDQNCKDPSRVMRLPGFAYIDKTTGKPNGKVAEVVHSSTNRYSAEEIEACLPSLLTPKAAPPAPATPPPRGLPHRTLQEIEAAAYFIPERVVGCNTYERSRRALCGCAAALAEIGLPEEQALDLLAGKWPDRATAQQALQSSSTRNPASFWAIAGEHGYGLKRTNKTTKTANSSSSSSKPTPAAPKPSKPKERKARPMSHSKAMACFDRCVEVQAQRERNSLRRRARLLKAAKDLGLAAYINRQEIGQKVLEAKARCNGEAFKPLTAADRAAMPKPVVRWLVRGLIPANDLTIIGGRPKVGKTRVAVAIVAAVLSGEPFLEFPVAASTPPVLLVTDDQSAGDTAEMLTALGIWTHPRLVTSDNFRLTEPDLDALLEAIKANPGALVVIDSLRSIGRSLQHGENDPEIGATLYDLKQSVIDAGGTLLLIHHCNKAADLVGVEALSGHGAISGAANTVITLHHCPNDKGLPDKINPQRRLFSEGRSGECCDLVIDRAASGSFRQVSTFEHWQQQLSEAKKNQKPEQLTTLQQQVVEALEDSGEWMTRRQVCDAIGVAWTERGRTGEPKNVGRALTRLVELEAAESQRAGVESTFRISFCTQNEVVPMVTVVPPSNANGSQWHHAMTAGGASGATSPVATTGGDIENDCYDKVAPLSPLAPAIGDPLGRTANETRIRAIRPSTADLSSWSDDEVAELRQTLEDGQDRRSAGRGDLPLEAA